MQDQPTTQETIAQLLAEVAELRAKVARLEAQQATTLPLSAVNPPQPTSRRRLLKGLALGIMGLGTGLTVAKAPSAQARQVNASNPAVIITPNGATITGSVPTDDYTHLPYSFGLVATSDHSLELQNLTFEDAAITGITTTLAATGVVGLSLPPNKQAGVGVYGFNEVYIGVEGVSINGNGVFALTDTGTAMRANANTGIGIWGYSGGTGYGCVAESKGGAPFRLMPKAVGAVRPTTGIDIGAFWLENNGDLWVYTSSGWKQIQYM